MMLATDLPSVLLGSAVVAAVVSGMVTFALESRRAR
jgi:hypothetical protein